jgi:hypothetical protein
MPSLVELLGEGLGSAVTRWSALTAVWTAMLYGIGYVALRFQLTALGIGTDLSVLDERYLFEGAKFLLLVTTAIPLGLLLGLPIAALAWMIVRVLPGARDALVRWYSVPARPLIGGIVFAVLFIQIVMRQCLAFNDLLLAAALPGQPPWLRAILLADDDISMNLFIVVLLLGVGLTAACLPALGAWETARPFDRALGVLLVVLLGVELLLLPVNYGYLGTRRAMPRVVLDTPAEAGRQAWLVWEGKDGVTYLVRDPKGGRRLITEEKGKLKRTEMVAYDQVLRMLYGGAGISR